MYQRQASFLNEVKVYSQIFSPNHYIRIPFSID